MGFRVLMLGYSYGLLFRFHTRAATVRSAKGYSQGLGFWVFAGLYGVWNFFEPVSDPLKL